MCTASRAIHKATDQLVASAAPPPPAAQEAKTADASSVRRRNGATGSGTLLTGTGIASGQLNSTAGGTLLGG